MSGAQPVRLELSPSARFAAVILVAHLAAAACVLAILKDLAGGAIAVLMLALGVAAAWDRALLRAGRSPRTIEFRPSGEARCVFANGESAALEPLGGSAVTRHWAALRLRTSRRRSLLVVAGMLPPGPLRLLRLWALWGKLPGAASRRPPA